MRPNATTPDFSDDASRVSAHAEYVHPKTNAAAKSAVATPRAPFGSRNAAPGAAKIRTQIAPIAAHASGNVANA